MSKQVLRQLKDLEIGDLVRVEWVDASVGKSLGSGNIDVPVFSYGIYLGCLGERHRHIIVAQNGFRYSNGVFDVDYTAIPVSWGTKVSVIKPKEVNLVTAQILLTSFLQGRTRTSKRSKVNH